MNYFAKLRSSVVLLLGMIGLYLRNSFLSKENRELKEEVLETEKISDIEEKVTNASENTKPVDINGITDLMRKDKL